ncbi:PKD domain-containing protein [Arsenicicoccus dermatophilus]|uniref:PKD domain-containing protein n=1 Tax=Arsenicicoccus dermatophilus TaxID=1076331 RepID=UPI0039172B56
MRTTFVPPSLADPSPPAATTPAAPAAPGAPPPPPQPQLTLPMIADAFVNTPFAKPTAQIQPVGGRTLVTLPTFVSLGWEAAGYEPGETRTVQLLGHAVAIRPLAANYLYDFGDGAVGPTTRRGGPYPTGDVSFAYRHAGTYQIKVTATYTGEFSVDGGPWTPIATTVPIPGPATPLDVRTSRNELIEGG